MTPLNAGAEPPPSMVERMTLIMDAFAGRAALLTLEDVARRTRLPRSTAHRILDQLVRLDWLEHTSSGYRLGRRALGLGGDGGHGRIREAAAPLLHELQLSTGLVVHLAVLDGADVRFLDKAGGPLARSVPSRVGGRAPARATALGRAILAWLEPERVEALIGDPGSLHQELHRVRQRRGLAFERGDCFPGITSVAAAIRGPEGPVAGISLAGDSRAPLERVAPLVRDAARQASRALFPEPEPLRHAARVPHRGRLPGPIDRLLTAGRGDRS